MNLIRKIFRETKTIAVVGLSPDSEKPSHKVAKYLQSCGFKIIPIYPKEELILGEKVYRNLDEVGEKVDMVDVFRKSEFAYEVLEQIKKRNDVKTLWLQLGITNDEVMEEAQSLGLNAVQDRCTAIEYDKLENL